MKVIIQEADDNAGFPLTDEWGWWERRNGILFVWVYKGLSFDCKIAVVIHEIVEGKLYWLPHWLSHKIANVIEWLLTGAPCGLWW